MFKNIFNSTAKCMCNFSTKVNQKPRSAPLRDRNEILSNLVLKNTSTTPQAWAMLREQLFNASKKITVQNIDSSILNLYMAEERYELAKSYINYLQNQNIKLNLAGFGKYFKLHYVLYSGKSCPKNEEEKVLMMYKNILKEYPILDSITSEHIILGLSLTREWRKCLQILTDMRITAVPNTAAFNAVVSAAFYHNDIDTGWSLFQEMIEHERLPTTQTYLSCLDRISKSDQNNEMLDNLLNLIASYNLEVNERVIEKISIINGKKAKYTSLSKDGVCRSCHKKLRQIELSTSEFEQLKNAFFKNVIVGKDVFRKTTPDELKRFQNFVENMGKFDVIIDGLNVAYSSGVKQPPLVHSILLASVVRHFVEQRKRVLVMGRIHMEKLPQRNWNFVKKNATVFLLNDISQDDPYILYCGLHSGINTIIVTRDFMRSHLYLLKDKFHKLLFSRWLSQNRYHLIHANEEKVIFKTPLSYMVAPQKDGDYWHIPYVNKESMKDPVYKWLCLNT